MCNMTWLTIGRRRLRVLAGVAVCCVAVSGCADGVGRSGGAAASGGSDSSRGAASRAGVEMSGGYVVDEGGRLVQPERSWPDLVVDPVMKEESVEGVEAFARYFVAVAERAWNTGDTTELKRISSAACSLCSSMVSSIDDRYATGGWVDGLNYDVKSASEPIVHPGDHSKYAVTLRFSTSALASYDGSSVSPISDVREILELHTCWTDREWVACGAIGNPDDS